MVDVIEWKELAGCHGIGTGNLKAVKIDWTWLEVLKFFIVWSYTVVGVGVDENLTDSWTPGAKDFLPKKKKFQPKPKKVVNIVYNFATALSKQGLVTFKNRSFPTDF